MSSNDFFGRPLTKSINNLEFDLCEVCLRKTPQWLEVQYQQELPVLRFTCKECHEEYMQRDQNTKINIAREIKEDEEITEAVRPGWIDEFIQEQKASGNIATVGSDGNQEELLSEPQDVKIEDTGEEETEGGAAVQIAPWTSKFIQEALFGPNPEGWLESVGGYHDDSIELTIQTLGSFLNHDVPSVKLSAIQCLLGAYRRHNSHSDQIEQLLDAYSNDLDETVASFAKQTLEQVS